jgi:hypothetical protein
MPQEEDTMAGTFQISVPTVARPRLRPRLPRPAVGRFIDRRRPAVEKSPEEGAPLLRLFGVALLGWVALMSVVAVIAVY